jgi:hypothetical protein
MQAGSETEINNRVKTAATERFVYLIINTSVKEQPGYNPKELINYLKQIISKEDNRIKDILMTSIGIRG